MEETRVEDRVSPTYLQALHQCKPSPWLEGLRGPLGCDLMWDHVWEVVWGAGEPHTIPTRPDSAPGMSWWCCNLGRVSPSNYPQNPVYVDIPDHGFWEFTILIPDSYSRSGSYDPSPIAQSKCTENVSHKRKRLYEWTNHGIILSFCVCLPIVIQSRALSCSSVSFGYECSTESFQMY